MARKKPAKKPPTASAAGPAAPSIPAKINHRKKKPSAIPNGCLYYVFPAILIVGLSIFLSPPEPESTQDTIVQKPPPKHRTQHPFLFPIGDPSKLPAEIHAGHVSQFFGQDRVDDLYWGLDTLFQQSARQVKSIKPPNPRWHQLGSGYLYTSRYKLRHDLEQAQYLARVLQDQYPDKARMFAEEVVPVFSTVLGRMPPEDQLPQGLYPFSKADKEELNILNYYNKALWTPHLDAPRNAEGVILPVLHPDFNPQQIEQDWQDHGIAVIDNVLAPHILDQVMTILLESTVFYQTKPPKKGQYVGAYLADGLHDRLLLEIGRQVAQALPSIFQDGRHALSFLWAYKYDSNSQQGIHLHADEAAVNMNVWLTPDEANLDPSSGGLVVYTTKPPLDWDFRQYNSNPEFVKDQLLAPSNFANVTIPYRQNRCVLFDSALFHHTDTYKFKPGYENRRINLTYLYGEMQKRK